MRKLFVLLVTAMMCLSASSRAEDQKINILMREFKIETTLGGQIKCYMNFYAQNATEKPLDSLTINMEWPGMKTNMSFSDVGPKQNKMESTILLGNGCYSMTKKPKITVETCRIEEMEPEKCKALVTFK